MNYKEILKRKKEELQYAERRLISAVDDFNQCIFHPDTISSEEELKLHISNWKKHVASLQADITCYQNLINQKALDWGFE